MAHRELVPAQGDSSLKIDFCGEKLDDDNWVAWKWHMTRFLRSKNLIDVIQGPIGGTKNDVVLTHIGNALSKKAKGLVVAQESAFEAWKILETVYENKTTFEKQDLLAKLHSFRFKNNGTIADDFSELQTIISRLRLLGHQVDDDTQISIIMRALPKEFDHLLMSFKMLPPATRTLAHLTGNVLSVAREMQNKLSTDETAFISQKFNKNKTNKRYGASSSLNRANNSPRQDQRNNSARKEGTCNFCKKPGHWKDECWKNPLNKNRKPQYNKQPIRPIYRQMENGRNNEPLSLMALEEIHPNKWIFDSGSSMHMTSNREWLDNIVELENPINIKIGDGSHLLALAKGKVVTNIGIMDPVYYVPKLAANLFSASSVMKKGFEVVMREDKVELFKGNKLVATGTKEKSIFLMDIQVKSIPVALTATKEEWHKRFCHVSSDLIEKMYKNKIVDGLKIGDSAETCKDCALNKYQRTSHRPKSTITTTIPGEVLHFDTVGPNNVASLEGNSTYWLLCKDEATRYRMAAFMSTKADIPAHLMKLIRQANFVTKNRVAYIVTDNTVHQYTKQEHIIHKKSAPYVPQQNGFIERDIGTITRSARTLLNSSKLEQNLWAEAVRTAIYALNRCINSSDGEKTPYEKWFGSRPNVSNLRVFGQKAFILDHHKHGKFEQNAKEVIFVGYTDTFNTYRFFDKTSNKIVISCDVTFEKIKTITSDHYVYKDGDTENRRNEIENQPPVEPDDPEDSTSSSNGEETKTDEGTPKPSDKVEVNLHGGFGRPRVTFHPDVKTYTALLSQGITDTDPLTYEEAMNRPDKDLWKKAIEEEFDSINKNNVWTIVDKPLGKNIVSTKWIFKIKKNPEGDIQRYKARLVARGFLQRYGVDYLETYAPVASSITIRLLLAAVPIFGWKVRGFDVKTAFLYGDLEEKVYIEQPEGFNVQEGKVLQLNKSLYGLKQAPRQWNIKFTSILAKIGLIQAKEDKCIFYKSEPLIIICIYVDDGLIFSADEREIDIVLDALKCNFDVHSVDPSTYLGFQIKFTEKSVTIHQSGYIQRLLKTFGMDECAVATVPAAQEGKVDDSPVLDGHYPYRELVGALLYAAVTVRPDIAYAVSKVGRKLSFPTENDWKAAKHILRYLKGTVNLGITYDSQGERKLIGFSDSDFAGDKTGKSTSGRVVFLGNAAIYWKSTRQTLVTLSSTEAELVSLCDLVKDVTWIRRLALELNIIDEQPIEIRCDNTSAIRIVKDEKAIQRTRHMTVRASYPREQEEKGIVSIQHCKSDQQRADILTKVTSINTFLKLRKLIMNLLTFFTILSVVNAETFELSGSLLWRNVEDKLVYGKSKIFDINYCFQNPCLSIRERMAYQPAWTAPNPYWETQQRCSELWKTRFLANMQRLVRLNDSMDVEFEDKEIELNDETQMTFDNRQGRMIGAIIEGVKILCYTNMVKTVWDYFSPSEDNSHIKELFQAQQTRTKVIETILNSVENLTREVNGIKNMLLDLYGGWPKHVIAFIAMANKIDRVGDQLEAIVDKAREGRIDTKKLAKLLNVTNFDQIIEEDTTFIKAAKLNNNCVKLVFTANIASTDTIVYRIDPFKIWTELTDRPKYMKYDGPSLIIHNYTSDCTTSVLDEFSRMVTQRCNKAKYRDPRLDSWKLEKVVDTIEEIPLYTEYKLDRNKFHIYCFPDNITVTNEGMNETYRCPTIPFKISVANNFSTTSETIMNEIVILNVSQISPTHMGHEDVRVSEISLSEDYREIIANLSHAKKLIKESVMIDRNMVRSSAVSLSSIIVLCALCILGRYLHKRYSEFRKVIKRMDSRRRRGSPVPRRTRYTGVEQIKLEPVSEAQEGVRSGQLDEDHT